MTTRLTAAQRKARSIRQTAGGTFYTAAAVTAAANVYASQHTWLGVAVGLWTPVAFFLALELLERIPVTQGWAGRMRQISIGFLALIAGWESYWHLVHVLTEAGTDTVGRYLMPFTVDVLMVVARIAMNHRVQPSRPSSRRKPSNVRELKPKKAAA